MKHAAVIVGLLVSHALTCQAVSPEAKACHEVTLSWTIPELRVEWTFDKKTDAAKLQKFNEAIGKTLAVVDGYQGSFETGDTRQSTDIARPFGEMGLRGLQQDIGQPLNYEAYLTQFQRDNLIDCRKAARKDLSDVSGIHVRFFAKVSVLNQSEHDTVLDGSGELPVTFSDYTIYIAKPKQPLAQLDVPRGGTRDIDFGFTAEMDAGQLGDVFRAMTDGVRVDLLLAKMRILQEGRDMRLGLLAAARQTYTFAIAYEDGDVCSWTIRKHAGANGAELTVGEILEKINAMGQKSDKGNPLFTMREGRCIGVGDLTAVGKDYMLVANHMGNKRYFLWDWPLETPIRGSVRLSMVRPGRGPFRKYIYNEMTEGLKRYESTTHDVWSQIMIGECYERRDKHPDEIPECVVWFRKAAEQGNADAMYNVRECYRNGWGVEKDETLAQSWLCRAAEAGCARAQYEFGSWCAEHKSKQEALEWYRKSAEQGEMSAVYSIGYAYERGLGVERDAREAVKWFRKAANMEYLRAQSALGGCYYRGDGIERNFEEAVKWYRAAALRGSSIGLHQLGYCYYEGLGMEKDGREAIRWYLRATAQGNVSSMNNIGYMYKNGIGVEKNGPEAVKWLKLAIDKGNNMACKTLGLCYLEGFGVEKNEKEGIRLLRKAVELGISSAEDELRKIGVEH